jgi:hypothetical protein
MEARISPAATRFQRRSALGGQYVSGQPCWPNGDAASLAPFLAIVKYITNVLHTGSLIFLGKRLITRHSARAPLPSRIGTGPGAGEQP